MAQLQFLGPFSTVAYIPASVAAATSFVAVGALERKTLTLESVGTATYQVQISNDPSNAPAAASWQNEGAALTAAGSLEITKPCAWIRINTTAYTSGTPIMRVSGVSRL